MSDKWMTYAELGGLMGCSADAARARAVRRRWRRQVGNDGTARVLVPDDEDLKPRRTGYGGAAVPRTLLPTSAPTLPPTYTTDPELLQRLDRLQALQAEMTEMARKFGATEAELRAAQTLLDAARRREDDLTRERDEWRAQAQQLVAVGGELQAVREERERLLGDSEAMRERIAGAERDRDQALERLNASIDRLDRVQTEHHTEITAVREQMAQAERDRDRLAAELETHLRMPWWRRLFA